MIVYNGIPKPARDPGRKHLKPGALIREVSLERWLKAEVEKRGGRCIKLVRSIGIPDRLVLLPGGKMVFIELKTHYNDLSSLQIWWLEHIIQLGFDAACIRDKEALINLLNQVSDV